MTSIFVEEIGSCTPLDQYGMSMGQREIPFEFRQEPETPSAPAVASAEEKIFMQRAHDSGTGVYVYWTTFSEPDPTPAPSETQPNYTGVLSVYAIVKVIRPA